MKGFTLNTKFGAFENCQLLVHRYLQGGTVHLQIWDDDGCVCSPTYNPFSFFAEDSSWIDMAEELEEQGSSLLVVKAVDESEGLPEELERLDIAKAVFHMLPDYVIMKLNPEVLLNEKENT